LEKSNDRGGGDITDITNMSPDEDGNNRKAIPPGDAFDLITD